MKKFVTVLWRNEIDNEKKKTDKKTEKEREGEEGIGIAKVMN